LDADTPDLTLFAPPPLPSRRWELTAPESHLLRYGDDASGSTAFKLALMELVTRGALRLEAGWIRRWPGRGTRFAWLVADGHRMASATEPALAPVLGVFERASERRIFPAVSYWDHAVEFEGVIVPDIAKAASRRGFSRFIKDDVAGALRARGLLTDENRRTPAGAQADDELERWLELSRQFPRWSQRDDGWGRVYLQRAGAAVLLTGGALPPLVSFAQAHATGVDAAWPALLGPQLDNDFGLGAFGALDAWDGSFTSFDVGGGGDGGGF
jgi:hypothetical protein